MFFDYVINRLSFLWLGKRNVAWKVSWLWFASLSHSQFQGSAICLYHLLKFDYFFELLWRQLVFHDAAFIDILPLLIIFICFVDEVDNVIVRIHAFDVHLYLWTVEILFFDIIDGIGVDAEEGGVLCQNLVFY